MKKPKKLRSAFQTYIVGRQLGQGGAGYVYKVTADEGASHAAKVLDPSKANTERLSIFTTSTAFVVGSPMENIVPARDYGLTDEGTPFFIMPLFDSSLRNLIGNSTPELAIEIFGRLLDGVEAAHLHKVIHRDLKPENILIRHHGQEVAVADFGIARFMAEDFLTAVETKDGAKLANFQYAAPEQRVRGGKVDNRADIYALGLILNELFTGNLALGVNYPLIENAAKEYSFLDPIVERMLQQDPGRRFQTIEELKQKIRGRQQVHLNAQKLDQLRKRVVPEGEITDPVLDPPRIVGVDWDDGVLRIRFQQPITREWLNALWGIKDHYQLSWAEGGGPETVIISGNMSREACMPASSGNAVRVLEHFKDWVPKANAVYADKVGQRLDDERKRKVEKLEADIAAAEERKKVLARLTP